MKKIIITVLLVLPLLLIYFISFAGQIFSKYNHIDVDRITILNEDNQELNQGDTIKLAPDQQYNISIKLYPELATDKTIIISNSNKNVCELSANGVITTYQNGESKIIITSKDRHFVQFTFNILVTQDDIVDFVLDKTTVSITVGKVEKVDVTILPDTTLSENRRLIWTSTDVSIATVTQDGIIKGVAYGTTTITVQSAQKPELIKTIVVNVNLDYGTGLYFAHTGSGVYKVNTQQFDLKSITIVNIDGVTIDDVWYTLDATMDATAIDSTQLSEGIIKFLVEKKWANITVHAYINETEYTDNITIWYTTE